MELIRFIALEKPSSSAIDSILKVDIETDLKNSALADQLFDPKTRAKAIQSIRANSLALPSRTAAIRRSLDALAASIQKGGRTPVLADVRLKVVELFGLTAPDLLIDAKFLEARGRLAEAFLVDRLAPTKRAKPEQLATKTRLQCVGLLEYLAGDDTLAIRALRVPSCIAIVMNSKRLGSSAAAPAVAPAAGPATVATKQTSPAVLRKAERELTREFGALVSAELEKSANDDFDSRETRIDAAPSKGSGASRSMADIVLQLRSSPAVFKKLVARISLPARIAMSQLGLPKSATFEDAREVIAQKKRLLMHSGPVLRQYRNTSSGSPPAPSANNLTASAADGAPDTVGSAKLLGSGKLYRVVDRVIGYETSQLSEVYTIPMGSTKERELRIVERSEETNASLNSKVTEQETETRTDERFSLASESRKLSAFEADARAGGSFSATYGTVAAEGSAEAGVGLRSESSEEMASAYAKNVVTRAANKITERVEQVRQSSLFRERMSAEKEGYTNTSAAHITGIYLWINEIHEARVLEYDSRMMFEVVVPKPGANLLWAPNSVPPNPAAPHPPPEFDVLLDDPNELTDDDSLRRAIGRDTYLQLAAKYGARDVPAPPESVKIVMRAVLAGDQTVKGTFVTVAKTEQSVQVPEGYEAAEGWMLLVASRQTDPGAVWYRVVIGATQYKFLGGTHSKRMFSKALEISEVRGNFRGTVPVSIIGREDRAAVVHVLLVCTPTQETMESWRAEVYSALHLAHKRALQEYQDAAGSAFAAPVSRNPEQLRRIERDEVKRGCLTILTGQHFQRFNALPANQSGDQPPSMLLSDIEPEGSWIQFFETAVEWENADFVLYPYFWSDRADWARALTMRTEDPKHEEFLRAGAARVLLPVRKGFESAILRYLESPAGSPVLWDGLDPDLINLDSPMHVAVWQEIKERQGQLSETPLEIDSFRVAVPTNHRILKADGVLPAPPPEA